MKPVLDVRLHLRRHRTSAVQLRLNSPRRQLDGSVVVPDTTTVTRRFCARPSSLSLLATGRDDP
jgi:hypothetical protein